MLIHFFSNNYQLIHFLTALSRKTTFFYFILRKLRQRVHEKFAQGQSLSIAKLNKEKTEK